MKFITISLLISAALLVSTRADLTIVEKVEGLSQGSEMTIKIKGDKARFEITPQVTTIIDGKTGDIINLMNNDQKFVRMSANQVKAMAEMAAKFKTDKPTEKPKLTPTGKKETINGYEAEEYTYDGPIIKGSYWISTKFPDAAAILKQLQGVKQEVWKTANAAMPDYRDFPGLPIKSQVTVGDRQITTTIASVKQDTLTEAEFIVPADFQEMKMPFTFGGKPASAAPAVPPMPKP